MADEVVVKHGKDGKITVCIGEQCVTVSCAEAEEPGGEEPGGPMIGGPMISIQSVTDVFDDLDAVEWQRVAPGVETARAEGARLTRRQVD